MSFLKILVIGDVSTGKTALVNRLVNNTFSDKYKATLGCEFGLKTIEITGKIIRVQLWDLAGQDRLGGISRLYCRDANGALVVSDISNERTIDRAINWKSQVDDHVRMPDGSRIPMVLCVNKYDLCNPAEAMSEAALQRIVVQNEFVSGFFTSAMSSFNVENAFHKLVEEVLSRSSPGLEDEQTSNARVARLSIPLFTDDRKKKPQKCC
jgi:Ras-related protein Rab-32